MSLVSMTAIMTVISVIFMTALMHAIAHLAPKKSHKANNNIFRTILLDHFTPGPDGSYCILVTILDPTYGSARVQIHNTTYLQKRPRFTKMSCLMGIFVKKTQNKAI
jgi:hypothetical protein